MRRLLMGIGAAAVIAICASPALAGSRRHGSDGGSGSGSGSATRTHVTDLEFPSENADSDSERPMGAVPEPTAGLVFAAGALVLASRMRRRSQ